MKAKILFLMVSALLVASCTGGRQNKVSQAESPEPTPVLVRGKLVLGHEARSFTAEGDTVDYWIIDKTEKLDSLYEAATKESTQPYTPVHAELKVVDAGKAEDGFAADYDGTYKVVEIIKVTPLNTPADH